MPRRARVGHIDTTRAAGIREQPDGYARRTGAGSATATALRTAALAGHAEVLAGLVDTDPCAYPGQLG